MYIVIEGADGSGKTTLAKLLVEELNSEGIANSVFITEPTNATSNLDFRDILKYNKLDKKEQLLIFYANRVSISTEIARCRKQQQHVISDRSHVTGMIYQDGLAQGGHLMKELDHFVNYPIPDFIFLIHRESEIKAPDDEIEKTLDMVSVRRQYRNLKPKLNQYYGSSAKPIVVNIENNGTLESALEEIKENLSELFNVRK